MYSRESMFEQLDKCLQYKDPMNAVIFGIEASVLLAKAHIALDVECLRDEMRDSTGCLEEAVLPLASMSSIDYMTEAYRMAYEAGKVRAMHSIPNSASRAMMAPGSDLGQPMDRGYDSVERAEDILMWADKVGDDRRYFYWLEVHRLKGGFYQLMCRHNIYRKSVQCVGDRHVDLSGVEREFRSFCDGFYGAEAEARQDAYEHQLELDAAEREMNPFC